jgi:hypothetical protein
MVGFSNIGLSHRGVLLEINLTKVIGQSPRDANSHSASQDIPHFYETRSFITVFKTGLNWSVS